MEVLGNAVGIIYIVVTLVIGTAIFFKLRYIYLGNVATGMFRAWLECVVGTFFALGLVFWMASAAIYAVVAFIIKYWLGILGTIVLLVGIGIWCGLFESADDNEENNGGNKAKKTGLIVCCIGLLLFGIGVFHNSEKEAAKNVPQASTNQNINAKNNNKISVMAEEAAKGYSNKVLKCDVSGTDKFNNKIRLENDISVNLFDGRSGEQLEEVARKNLRSAFQGNPEMVAEAQMSRIIEARLNLQKKAEFNTEVIINSDNKAVVRLAIKCIDSALMEKTFEEFLKGEAPKRIASYNPGKSFFSNIQSAPTELISILYADATEYACGHPSFKKNVTTIDLEFSRDAEKESRLRIKKIPEFEIVQSFWDGKYEQIFFDNKLFNMHMNSVGN
jgi:hypothetical protein